MADESAPAQPRARSAKVTGLSPEKRRLLEQRLRERTLAGSGRAGSDTAATTTPTSAGRIPRRAPHGRALLSDAQLPLLLLQETNEGLTAYNVAQAVRIDGPLDLGALRQAIDDLYARHDVLRSRFSLGAGSGQVDFAPVGPADVTVSEIDDVDAFVRRTVTESFDLESGRLLKARIGAFGPDRHVLVLVTHHIVSDAVSKSVLTGELNQLYVARRDGHEPALPPVAFDYADYAAWQAERPDASAELDWWRARLTGAPEQTDLPVDRPRPPRADFSGAKHRRRLDAAVVAGASALAREQRTTLFVVLLATYAGLLQRYGGQDDLVVGSPTSGRHHEEFARVVGLFLNVLPLRVDASGDPTFAELIARVRSTATDAYKHQDVPFDRIVEAVRPPRVLGRNPIFQSMFTLKQTADAIPVLDGLEVTPIGFEGGWTKFDLTVVCNAAGAELDMMWQYATALFDARTVATLAAHFERLLRAGVAEPDVRLSALTLAEDDDLTAVQAWNATATVDAPRLVHEVVREQAARTPEAEAVGDETGWITYRELELRANRLAHHLVAAGVRPDARVAVYLDRSIDLEVALLAILKAGGAYVPLDTGYPRDRLQFMLEDSNAVAVVTSASLQETCPESDAQTVVVERVDLSGLPDTPPRTEVRGDNLAYVLYTSGTTGRPKGVEIEHHSIANQIEWLRDHLSVGPADTVLQKTPVSFDVAGWETLLAPAAGARLYMARPGGHLDPDYLIDIVQRHAVSVINFVPSMLAIFLAREAVAGCRSLRLVIAAGEALPDETGEVAARVLPNTQLWNIYGPTETIGITYERCRPGRAITIGRPMQNCVAYVLDTALGHQPVGMPGELWLGGTQVARGYLDRPELTAERFVETPYGRMYRTGDRAVWRADGRLQYLGRLDQQVKLRGFRIELSEVEAVMSAHPSVQAACAVVGRTGSGTPTLTAFATVRSDADSDQTPVPAQELVAQWRAHWDETYSGAPPEDQTFDIRGWNDSFTGRPASERDMRAAIGATVERIAGLRPRTVLEVGAGTGLLLWRLGPRVARYDVTDFSARAVDYLRSNERHHDATAIAHQGADEVTAPTPGQRYDCVVLHSVVQYFPDPGHLTRTLDRALGVLDAGGTVFVGDVRDLRLQDARALELTQLDSPTGSVVELQALLADRRLDERELLVDPGFFHALPGASHVQVLPRRGDTSSEIERFRYDVVLHTEPGVARAVDEWLEWPQIGDLDALEKVLAERGGGELGVLGVPNLRVAATLRALDELRMGRMAPIVAGSVGVDPEQMYRLAAAAGLRAELSCARDPGAFDVAFVADDRPVVFPATAPTAPMSNDPSRVAARRARRAAVIGELSASIRASLPDYMVPNSIRILEQLPLGPSGKLDRKALSELTIPVRQATPVAPRTDTERRLAALWQDALGLDVPISVDDSFFDLGGSSLVALTVFPRIEREFRVKLALAVLFENVTVASLAAVIDAERERRDSWDLVVPIRSSGYKRPLFLMPEQRGDVLAYRQMVDSMDHDRPVYGIQCVGLDGRATPRLSIEDIAADCVTALRRVQPEGPYLLGGYCFGGVVAFEVASQLIAAGEQVEFLGIIDATPFGRGGALMAHMKPTLKRRLSWRSRVELRRKLRYTRDEVRWHVNFLVTRVCVRLGVMTPRRFVDVHAANRYATRTYVAPDVPVEMTLFRASTGSLEADELRKQRWEIVATKGVRMYVISGHLMTHNLIVRAAYAPRLASAMNECLADLR